MANILRKRNTAPKTIEEVIDGDRTKTDDVPTVEVFLKRLHEHLKSKAYEGSNASPVDSFVLIARQLLAFTDFDLQTAFALNYQTIDPDTLIKYFAVFCAYASEEGLIAKQTGLVYDGDSFVVNRNGSIRADRNLTRG